MIVELLQPWQGLPVGHRLVDVPDGQAELWIARGVCREVATRDSERADSRADNAQRSEKAAGNRKQRHKP